MSNLLEMLLLGWFVTTNPQSEVYYTERFVRRRHQVLIVIVVIIIIICKK